MSPKRWSILNRIKASTKKVKTKVLNSLARAQKGNSEPELADTFVNAESIEEACWEDGSSS
jgi:hypothetical protein